MSSPITRTFLADVQMPGQYWCFIQMQINLVRTTVIKSKSFGVGYNIQI